MTFQSAEIHPMLPTRVGRTNGTPVGWAADHQAPERVGTVHPPAPAGPFGVQPTARPMGAHPPNGLAQSAHITPKAAHAEHDAELERDIRHSGWLRKGFYVGVLGVALVGQISGAVEVFHLSPLLVAPMVGVLEMGGVVLLNGADMRRRVGERAVMPRLLSAGVAAWAVWFNWAAHHNHLLGGFFAGMSALGYAVWVMHVENKRRDRLRAKGDLPPTAPAYELWGHWVRHPLLTIRAKSLAKTDSRLGLYDSIALAKAQVKKERRDKAIASVLRRKITQTMPVDQAEIAVQVYDLDEIAAYVAASADYPKLAALIADGLTPDKLGAHDTGEPLRVESEVGQPIAMVAAQPTRKPSSAKRGRPVHRGRGAPKLGRTAQPTPSPLAQPTSPAHAQSEVPAQPALSGLTDLQRTRLGDLAQEFPAHLGDLPGRDKVMAHMKSKGFEGWASKAPAAQLIGLLKSQRAQAPTPKDAA